MSTRSGSAKPESACTNSRWSAWRLGGSWGVPAAATFSLCIDYEDRYVGRRYAGDAGGLGKRPRLEAEDLLTSLTRQLPERLRELSSEGREKILRLKPRTLAQASRIPGVSPADVSVLVVYAERERRRRGHAPAPA